MFKEKLEEVIGEIQSKNKELKKFPSLLEICEPGKSGFRPRKVNDMSGYVLFCPVKVKSRVSIIQGMNPSPTDFMGLSPFMMVVMESATDQFKPGDIVHVSPVIFNEIEKNFILVNSAVAYLFPDSVIQGIDGSITKAVTAVVETLKPNGDA